MSIIISKSDFGGLFMNKFYIPEEMVFLPNEHFNCRFLNKDTLDFIFHTHTFFEVFLNISGSQIHTANENTVTLEEGQCVLIRDFDYHSHIKVSDDFKMICLSFTKKALKEAVTYLNIDMSHTLFREKLPPTIMLTPKKRMAIIQKAEQVTSYERRSPEAIRAAKILLLQILDLFLDVNAPTTPEHSRLITAIEKMYNLDNLKQGLPLLIDLSGYSHEHLCRLMKSKFNATPTKWIAEQRLIYAANMLSNTDYSISYISDAVGFTSQSRFISLFKSKYNATPSKYRQSHQTFLNK